MKISFATVRGKLAQGHSSPRELSEAIGIELEGSMLFILLSMEEAGLVERCGTFGEGVDRWQLPQGPPLSRR